MASIPEWKVGPSTAKEVVVRLRLSKLWIIKRFIIDALEMDDTNNSCEDDDDDDDDDKSFCILEVKKLLKFI